MEAAEPAPAERALVGAREDDRVRGERSEAMQSKLRKERTG